MLLLVAAGPLATGLLNGGVGGACLGCLGTVVPGLLSLLVLQEEPVDVEKLVGVGSALLGVLLPDSTLASKRLGFLVLGLKVGDLGLERGVLLLHRLDFSLGGLVPVVEGVVVLAELLVFLVALLEPDELVKGEIPQGLLVVGHCKGKYRRSQVSLTEAVPQYHSKNRKRESCSCSKGLNVTGTIDRQSLYPDKRKLTCRGSLRAMGGRA